MTQSPTRTLIDGLEAAFRASSPGVPFRNEGVPFPFAGAWCSSDPGFVQVDSGPETWAHRSRTKRREGEAMKGLFGGKSRALDDRTRAVDDFVRSIALVTDPSTLRASITNCFRHWSGLPDGFFLVNDDAGVFRLQFVHGRVPARAE